MTSTVEDRVDVAALELSAISKRFGSTLALDKTSLRIKRGSIHALLGENGAGKTTLMRIAFGMISPDNGTITVNGNRVTFRSPSDAINAGIGMVHQQFSLVPQMTVAENVALGGRGRYDESLVAARLKQIAAQLGMTIDPSVRVKELSASERQKLEIIRSFAHGAATLILDEPTAVLTLRDTGELFSQLRAFANSGGSVVLITHKLQDALTHADEVTVLRQGRRVLTSPMRQTDETILATAMLGRASSDAASRSPITEPAAERVLEIQDVSAIDNRGITQLKNVSLQVNAGEIVGVAALEGAARPLLQIIARRLTPDTGKVVHSGRVGFVPEDRTHEAIIPDFTLTENVALKNAGQRTGLIDWQGLNRVTSNLIRDFDIRTAGERARVNELSGGNQQKLVLGRELDDRPDLLVLENPTQGLDVHAAAAIHEKIRGAKNNRTAIVFYSSDLDEIASLSDRVIVVSDGLINQVAVDRDAIGRALLSSVT